jgi:hypothetical protein
MMSEHVEKKGWWDDAGLQEAHSHLNAARQSVQKSMESLVPPEYVEHKRKARKEFLLAVRSLIDSAIERIEQTGEDTKPTG